MFNVAILPCRIEPVLQQKLWAEKNGTRRAGWQLYSEQEEMDNAAPHFQLIKKLPKDAFKTKQAFKDRCNIFMRGYL